MQLHKIKEAFARYEAWLGTPKAEERLFLWESQRLFQENWDLDAEDLAGMYDRSLQNSTTRRYWFRENYEPKKVMLALMGVDREFVRSMFKDLFLESKGLTGRADRFVFHCDQLLSEFKRQNPRSVENNHYHNDNYQIISLYLAFRYPDQYTFYDHEAFKRLMVAVGSRDIPVTPDIERFSKVMRTLYGLMKKEERLMELHRKRLVSGQDYEGESLLVVYDFYHTTGHFFT